MYFALVSLLLAVAVGSAASRPTEEERVRLWYEAGNTWPPRWQDETSEFKEAMRVREEELMMLPGADERWENFMQYTQSRLVPRFTPMGFKLMQTPPSIQARLKAALDKALENFDAIPNEPQIDALYTPIPSKFVRLRGLDWQIHNELLSLHEEWSGLKLRPTSIYGLRLNRNGSSLVMHYDKVETHVISAIVHVDHDYDGHEPWPIEIEDHNGQVHSVTLEPGQMLFYESASCLHGRRKSFKGKYYASVFVHYQPVDKSIWNFSIDDVIASVPPHWKNGVVEDHGNRWAGQGLTLESTVTQGAPPRVIEGKPVPDLKAYWRKRRGQPDLPAHSDAVHPSLQGDL